VDDVQCIFRRTEAADVQVTSISRVCVLSQLRVQTELVLARKAFTSSIEPALYLSSFPVCCKPDSYNL